MSEGGVVRWGAIALAGLLTMSGNAIAQRSTSHEDIPRGTVRFFSSPQNTRFASSFGAVTDFNNGEEVHAALVPVTGMAGLPRGRNAYIVQLSVDGAYRAEVEVELPPVGQFHRILQFPLFPGHRDNRLPRLAAAFKACLESTTGRHSYMVSVFQAQDRLFLASGGFTADAYMGMRRFHDLGGGSEAATVMQDSSVSAFLGSELDRYFPHLTLVKVEALNPWHEEPTLGGPILVCVVRYTVRDSDGNCYRGSSELRRVVRKQKGLGRVLGDVWPNEQGGCE